MSLKRQIAFRQGQILHFLNALELPTWMTGNAMRVGLLALLVVSSLAFVLRTGSSVALGYQIKAYETTIAELNEEQQKMAVEVATYRSMASVQARLQNLQMVPVAHIDHVRNATGVDLAIAKK